MTEQIDIADVVNAAMRGIRSQLETAQDLATGSARNVISNLLNEQGLLNIHFQSIMDAANSDADEFNGIIQELESRDSELSKVELALSSVKSRVAVADLERDEAQAEKSELESAIKLVNARIGQQDQEHRESAKIFLKVTRELKDLKASTGDIDKLKRIGREKQAELDELRKAMVTLRTDLARHRKEKARIAGDLADAGIKNNQLQDRVEDLSNRLTFNDGDVNNQMFESESGAHLYVYTFGFGVKCQEADRELITTYWHSEIRSTTGHYVMVMTDSNLSPVIPVSADIGLPPKPLIELLKSQILERCKDDFPDLYARRLWSEAASIDDLELSKAIVGKLKAANINTIFDVLTHPVRVMNKLPGIGDATANAAMNAAQAAVSAWVKSYEAEQRKAKKAA